MKEYAITYKACFIVTDNRPSFIKAFKHFSFAENKQPDRNAEPADDIINSDNAEDEKDDDTEFYSVDKISDSPFGNDEDQSVIACLFIGSVFAISLI